MSKHQLTEELYSSAQGEQHRGYERFHSLATSFGSTAPNTNNKPITRQEVSAFRHDGQDN